MAKVASQNTEIDQDAKCALFDLVHLLARQAARTYFADNGGANLSTAPAQLKTGKNDESSS